MRSIFCDHCLGEVSENSTLYRVEVYKFGDSHELVTGERQAFLEVCQDCRNEIIRPKKLVRSE